MSSENTLPGLDEQQLDELVQQLQSDEQISAQSTLESLESFEAWINDHPGLRQMFVVEKLADIGPALLGFLRAMLGFDQPGTEASQSDVGSGA